MITQPPIPLLLELIGEELSERIRPQIDDPTSRVNIEMVTALLSALTIRTENEIAWMLEESAAIEAAADAILPVLGDVTAVSEALQAHRAAPPVSMRMSHVAESYQRASELLSRLTEAAYASGHGQAIAAVQELMDSRLAIEQEAIGEFVAVGRD